MCSDRLTKSVSINQCKWPQTFQWGSSKSAHAWISLIFCMLNTYVITTTKNKLFYSSKAVRPQGGGGTLMYTVFVHIYDILNISLKSLTLLPATFFEWNMKEDSPGYTLLPLMCMNTSLYFFLTHQNLNCPHIEHKKNVSLGDSALIFTMFQFLLTHNIFRKVGQIHLLYACKFS